MNIQAWVNAFVLTPASCPTGVCAHGKSRSGPGVKSRMNSLLCVYGSNVWTLATRLVTVVEVNLRCFCVRLSLLFLVGWFLDLKTVGKKMVKLHVNACQVRKQVTVCWHLVLLEMGVKLSNYGKMCMNIQAWVNALRRPRVLRVSVRTGNRDLARAWNRGWIVCRMFELSLRDLWLSWKWTWGVFVFAWAYSFWWDGFWTLKRSGKLLRVTAHARHLVRGQNRVLCHGYPHRWSKPVRSCVCWHLVLLEMGVESCRITEKCVWISKPGLMRGVDAGLVSYGCLCAREIEIWPGREIAVNSLLCVYGSNVWTLATRLVTVVEVNLRCFCVRLSLLFLVGWFLDLKTVGKKMVKLHVNACQVRKQVTVCWHLVLLEMGVESCRITGKCVWISKPGLMRSCWRRPRVLRVSVRTGNRDLARAWNRG